MGTLTFLNEIRGDKDLGDLALEVIEGCLLYQRAVLDHQVAIHFYRDSSGQREAIQMADSHRRAVHDGLLVKYALLGRTYQAVKQQNCPLYEIADPTKRKEVAHLAVNLAHEIAIEGLK